MVFDDAVENLYISVFRYLLKSKIANIAATTNDGYRQQVVDQF